MKIILKGLINRKRLFSNIIIMVLLFLALSILSIILNYQDKLANIEFNKEEYRTLIFTGNISEIDITDKRIIKSNLEYGNGKIEIVFNTFLDMNNWILENNENLSNTEIILMNNDDMISINKVFKSLIFTIFIVILILAFILNFNYFYNLKESILMYHFLGYRRIFTLSIVSFMLGSIYTFLSVLIYLISYFIYFLLCKIINIKYFDIFNLNNIIIISIILIIELLILIIISEKSNK